MKKIISFCLSVTVAFSIASVSYANPNTDIYDEISSDPTNIVIYNDGNGNFAFTSTKSIEEKKKLFEERIPSEDGKIETKAWFSPKRLTSQDGTKNQVGTVWAQLETNLEYYKGVIWENDQVKFSGSSRSMFDGSIKATKITHSDTFNISALSFGAEMSGFPSSNPSLGISVNVSDRSGSITISKSGSAAGTNYIDSYYSNLHGSAYKITRATQTTSATYMIAGSGITASTSDGESWL